MRAAAGVTRDTIANAFQREAGQLVRLGRARTTRYAARHKLYGLDTDEFPVFRVDEAGKVAPVGRLLTLAGSESVWLPDENIIDGLPPELQDAAPKGFLGRSFARRNADLGLPENVAAWSDNHVLIALSRRGEDLPGNLLIGRHTFERFQQLQHEPRTDKDFPRLAGDALAGEYAGSSAGGEQPKFTALVAGRHRIVKFATDKSDNARRWRDLLMLEHIALRTLADAELAAAVTSLDDVDGLRCLIVDRFDRIGVQGRRAVLSLGAASGRIDGTWTDVADDLNGRDVLSDADAKRVALLDAYGALIANSDRHHNNILLFPAVSGYELAPAFDQLPMSYAPPASGNLRMSALAEPRPAANTLEVWDEAHRLAREFWRKAAGLELTPSMQEIVGAHASR